MSDEFLATVEAEVGKAAERLHAHGVIAVLIVAAHVYPGFFRDGTEYGEYKDAARKHGLHVIVLPVLLTRNDKTDGGAVVMLSTKESLTPEEFASALHPEGFFIHPAPYLHIVQRPRS